MDDRDGLAAIIGMGQAGVANLDVMGTATYLRLLAEDYGGEAAASARVSLVDVLQEKLDRGIESEPVSFRR
jgi:hypothetical protein